jgi:predicted HTH domain antitoxin
MQQLTIPYDEGLLLLTGKKPAEFEREARFLLALKLFELRRISAGKAAEMSGLNKPEFLLKASQMGVPVVDLDQDQLDAEFRDA